ncbi:MAG: hypothetical protein BWY54_00191 [Candidatus Dependentiae bacterium ADurb.Bin331]|nr:MAG: hypothetical protein BWY54_00191 [Candidatus Dependentiae bacterium ADurb.Bin331]
MNIFIKVCFFVLCASPRVHAISLVYNLKIRRAFNYPISPLLKKDKKALWVASAVPIVYKRDRHIVDPAFGIDVVDKRLTSGSLFNVRYIPRPTWWAELSTGFEHEHAQVSGTSIIDASRTGFDDIVFSVGHNFFIKKNTQFVLYALGGVPSRLKVTPNEAQDTLVGTRFFSVGVGSEFSYSFINSLPQSLVVIFQNRFLHFFNRRWPILPPGSSIQPGNVTDLLFAIDYRHKKNAFEIGYNPTIFSNQAVILPTQTIGTHAFVRQSGFASYSRLFEKLPLLHRPGLIGTGLLVSRAHHLDIKIVSIWVNFTTVF